MLLELLLAAALGQAQTPLPTADVAKPDATNAQDVQTAAPGMSLERVFSDLGRELKRLPSKDTALTLGLGGALALAVHPADTAMTRRATLSLPLEEAFESGDATGNGWSQAGAALGTWVIGRASGHPHVQAFGADLVQAQLVASLLTQGLKLSVDRKRPDEGRHSFPSGHASATFANATVVYRHLGWKAGLPAYGVASYVAASRLQANRHYASDVIFGAAIGIVAGRTVTVGRGQTRFAVSPLVAPGGAGVTFTRLPQNRDLP